MKITLIRHAPTSHNIEGLFMGDLDVPITSKGALIAKKLGLHLKSSVYTTHYSSPLKRSLETAKLLFPDAEIKVDSNLKERGLGLWTGLSNKCVRQRYPEAFLPMDIMDPLFTPPEGESFEKFVGRVALFLKSVISIDGTSQIAVVTHNGVIRVLLSLIEHRPLTEIFADWEPVLQPRTYELDNLKLSKIQKRINELTETRRL